MRQFKHVVNLNIPLASGLAVIIYLRSTGLEYGKDFNFEFVSIPEYDDFNIPQYDHTRFSFKDDKWITYLILKYG